MRTVVVGTAGHIDHGKSALVRALTGTDPDRLKEEQARGITIDLGFAHLAEADGVLLSFVDVPGHERFVKTMLAGASGIDVVLLVVAADESVMPQTREHLDICRLLSVPRGVVVLTKSDLADEETLELCRMELAELTEGTFLETAPVVPCSAVDGSGLPEVVAAIHAAAAEVPRRRADGPYRMPIDRVFSLKGFGTVVTGTASSGTISVGDDVELLPAGRKVRVRGLERHGDKASSGTAGERVALNLGGIGHDETSRGAVVVSPGSHVASSLLDVRLELVPEAPELKDLSRVRLHLGTAEVMARVRWAGGRIPGPGETGEAQLRLESPVVATMGDRLILRRYSPVITIGGGRVLHPAPTRKLKKGDQAAAGGLSRAAEAVLAEDRSERLAQLVEEAGPRGAATSELAAWAGITHGEVKAALVEAEASRVIAFGGGEQSWLAEVQLAASEERILARLASFHAEEPLKPGMPKQALAAVSGLLDQAFALLLRTSEQRGRIRVTRDLVALADHEIKLQADEEAFSRLLLSAHSEAGLRPPELSELAAQGGLSAEKSQRLVHLLVSSGELVKLKEGMLVSAEAMVALAADMASWYGAGEPFSVPDFKERSGVSRKHAIPLLEYLDAKGLTCRKEDGRLWLGKVEQREVEGNPS